VDGFLFDRVASGRLLKPLAVVGDATRESVSIVVEHSMGDSHLDRMLDESYSKRGRPAVIRTDSGREFTGNTMLPLAHSKAVTLRVIEPGRPNQNAYVKSCNGRLRDECLNEHWFTSLLHAWTVIDDWRRQCNERRCKKALCGTSTRENAIALAQRAVTMPRKL
jgi:transposase InsO family protein